MSRHLTDYSLHLLQRTGHRGLAPNSSCGGKRKEKGIGSLVIRSLIYGYQVEFTLGKIDAYYAPNRHLYTLLGVSYLLHAVLHVLDALFGPFK